MFEAAIYAPIVYTLLFFLCIVMCIHISPANSSRLVAGQYDQRVFSLVLAAFLIVFIGLRPISGTYFGDTITYSWSFEEYLQSGELPSEEREGVWAWLLKICANFTDVHGWFLVIDVIYIGLNLYICRKLAPRNGYLLFVAFLSSFLFFGSAVNGLRNALASSLVLLAMTLFAQNKKKLVLPVLLAIIAINTHVAVLLTVLGAIVASTVLVSEKGTKLALVIWVSSIFISLIASDVLLNFFGGLGIDDRMERYLSTTTINETMQQFSRTGFRWDFLLYSAMPIVFGWYLVVKRKITDRPFSILLNTYILTNAFWILVINAAFSNRFAALSWALYPFILAYPLVKFKIWNKRQGYFAAWILFGQALFTYFMWFYPWIMG